MSNVLPTRNNCALSRKGKNISGDMYGIIRMKWNEQSATNPIENIMALHWMTIMPCLQRKREDALSATGIKPNREDYSMSITIMLLERFAAYCA